MTVLFCSLLVEDEAERERRERRERREKNLTEEEVRHYIFTAFSTITSILTRPRPCGIHAKKIEMVH